MDDIDIKVSLFSQQRSETQPVIISIASGKGGCGCSTISANLGVLLSKKGYQVLVVDAALTHSDLHLYLGDIKTPYTLASLTGKEKRAMDEIISPTTINNLCVIAGASDSLEIANINYLTKQKLLAYLVQTPFDYIVIDTGSGTDGNTLDLFLFADVSIFVTCPDPVTIKSNERFLRAVILRQVQSLLGKRRLRALEASFHPLMPLYNLDKIEGLTKGEYELIVNEISRRLWGVILNNVANDREGKLGLQIEFLVRPYFSLPVRYIGSIEYDLQARELDRSLKSIVKNSPLCPFAIGIEKCANIIIKWKRGEAKEQQLPSPLKQINYYRLFNIVYNSSPKEIQAAYNRILEPFLETSPLSGCFYSKEERSELKDYFEEAYKTLISPAQRSKYDDELIENGVMRTDERIVEYKETVADEETLRAKNNVPVEASRVDIHEILNDIKTFDGASIKRIREAKTISIEEIVSETKIRSWYIKCIETQNFKALPAPIYLKGFLRQISAYLNLDSERVIEDYMKIYYLETGPQTI